MLVISFEQGNLFTDIINQELLQITETCYLSITKWKYSTNLGKRICYIVTLDNTFLNWKKGIRKELRKVTVFNLLVQKFRAMKIQKNKEKSHNLAL